MITGEMGAESRPKRFLLLKEQWPLVLELCHFTEELNPQFKTIHLLNHLKNLSQPIRNDIAKWESDEEKFYKVVQYFFDILGFSFGENTKMSLEESLIPSILLTRRGPEPVLMLLLCALFEECNVQVHITSCRAQYLLKVQFDHRSYIVDFKKKCAKLQHSEIVELINSGLNFSQGCLNSNSLVIEYLDHLKFSARQENQLKMLSQIHSYLMKFQPFNLKHISERAVVAFETGDYRSAVEDIRSYFQYKHGELSNSNLKNIYKLALKCDRKTKRNSL